MVLSPNSKLVRKYLFDTVVATGQAPPIVEIMRRLGQSRQQLSESLDELGKVRRIAMEPGSENIVHVPPFSNRPTPFRVTVEGEQKWYAHCGVSALGVSQIFPGKQVRIDTYCRDCAEPLSITMVGDKAISVQPETMLLHIELPVRQWFEDIIRT